MSYIRQHFTLKTPKFGITVVISKKIAIIKKKYIYFSNRRAM